VWPEVRGVGEVGAGCAGAVEGSDVCCELLVSLILQGKEGACEERTFLIPN
jgi:hypothetical protein